MMNIIMYLDWDLNIWIQFVQINIGGNELVYYIYGICDNDLMKIGYTNNVDKRLFSLQTGNPRILTCVFSYAIENKQLAQQIEKLCHSRYNNNKINGEWFSGINISDIKQYIKRCHIKLYKYNSNIKISTEISNGNDIIYSIIRNNPGITQAEILECIKTYDTSENWYHQKVSMLLKEMEIHRKTIKRCPYFNKNINRQIYRYYIADYIIRV